MVWQIAEIETINGRNRGRKESTSYLAAKEKLNPFPMTEQSHLSNILALSANIWKNRSK